MSRFTKISLIVTAILALSSLLFWFTSEETVPVVRIDSGLEPNKTKTAKYDKPAEKMAFEFERQKNPLTGTIPLEAKLKAYNDVKKRSQGLKDGLNGINWAERGPNNVGGRTRALMFDPNDVSNQKVWAGAVSGGIWFNNDVTDENSSWQKVDDFMNSLSISALAYDPTNTQVFYAGTGEGFFNVDAVEGLGVWKSTDAGATWTQLASTIPSGNGGDGVVRTGFHNVNDLVVTNAGTVIAVTRSRFGGRGGIMRSTDGGASWTNLTPAGAGVPGADLEIAANGDIYVSFGVIFSNGSVWRSTNDGATWTEITPPTLGTTPQRIELAVAPSASAATNTTVLYALAQNNTASMAYIQKSTDGGATWTAQNIPTYQNFDCTEDLGTDFTRGQAWYDLIAQVKPDDENTLIIGGVDLYRSTNGGGAWTRISNWFGFAINCGQTYVHADHHQIIFRPGSNTEAIFGHDGGVDYSTNISAATVPFSHNVKDYNVTQFYTSAIRNVDGDDEFLAGSQDNGTQRFTAAGINSTIELSGGDGGFCFYDQNDNRIITSFTNNNYSFYSAARNFLGDLRENTGRFINPSDYDSDLNILYSADNDDRLRVTAFNGASSVFNRDFNGNQISAITVSPHTASRIFVADDQGNVYRVDNANTNPSVADITTIDLRNAYINNIAVGADDQELVVCYSSYGAGHVFYTNDAGVNWVDKSDNLPDMPVYWALINPDNTDEVLLATEYGVWSTDALTTADPNWELTSAGLANVRCDMIKYRAVDNTAIVGTHGRGLYSATVFAAVLASDWNFDGSGDWEEDGKWLAGVRPSIADDITLDHIVSTNPYVITINSDAEVNNLDIVDNDITLIIEAGHSLSYSSITGDGIIILEDGASLVPNAGESGNVAGSFTVKRIKANQADYYNFWSSPVTTGNSNMLNGAQNLFSLDKGAGSSSSFYSAFSGAMENARGYAATNVSSANFTGLVNNGTISYGIEDNTGGSGGVFNLVGNPYPSAIAADDFVTENAAALLDGTVYLWSQLDANDRSDSENSIANFIAVNATGVSAYDQDATLATTDIASCQGFGVAAAADVNVVFENDMRNNSNNDFKSDRTLREAEMAWFSIAQDGVEQPILIAFGEQATLGSDFYYDAHSFVSTDNLQIASMIKDELFLINAFPLQEAEIKVPLSVTIPQAGTYSIALNKKKDVAESRSFVLHDKEANSFYDLDVLERVDFEAEEPSYLPNRFELILKNSAVGISDADKSKDGFKWMATANGVSIHSLVDNTAEILVYSSNGQQVQTLSIQPNEKLNLNLARGVYIVDFRTNNQRYTQRISW